MSKQNDGMTLRDWFAGQALAGILSDNSIVTSSLLSMFGHPSLNRADVAATASYAFADAMLKARER